MSVTGIPSFLENFLPQERLQGGIGVPRCPMTTVNSFWRQAGGLLRMGSPFSSIVPSVVPVEPYAREIAKLNRQGLLPSLIGDAEEHLSRALAIGAEWLGDDHSVLKCLRLGVAVHHGALPTPFRKEVERLLRDGVLKVTVSSPTLAQGLNLFCH